MKFTIRDRKEGKSKSVSDEVRKIAEELDWNITEYDDNTIEFQQYSPAGEDFSFTVNAENAEQGIYQYYDDFDVDDHIEMWIEAKKNGVGGVPSIRKLVEDAEAICNMLEKFAGAVMSGNRSTIAEIIKEA